MHWIFMCVARCYHAGTLSEIHAKTDQHCRAEDCMCVHQYGMICYRSLLIRESCHFKSDFMKVMYCCSCWTFRTQFKPRGQLTFISETVELLTKKLCKIWYVITEYLGRDLLTSCSLEKWTLKFKMLHLLNHICYFNKICRICGLNPRLKRL